MHIHAQDFKRHDVFTKTQNEKNKKPNEKKWLI